MTKSIFVSRLLLIFVSAATVLAAGCSEPIDRALVETERFHLYYNEGRFEDVLNLSTSEFRGSAGGEALVRILRTCHATFGEITTTEYLTYEVNFTNDGKLVKLTFDTSFGSEHAEEEFSWLVKDASTELVGYTVSSDALTKVLLDQGAVASP